jgi:hypothetical protein
MADKVKFVQLVTGTMATTGGATALYAAGSTWTVVYALADDGTVWWWGGQSWVQCGPQPEKPA